MHDIAFDAIHDEIVVTSPLAQGVLTFRGAADGEEAPIRFIQGDKTQIKGLGAAGKVSIDAVHNEIFFATPDQTILVFDRLANGKVAPKRVLGGSVTQLSLGTQNTDNYVDDSKVGPNGASISSVDGGGNVPCIRVDPVHNFLLVPTVGARGAREGPGAEPGGRILVFDRTARGNTAPKAIIQGPVGMGNQFEVYGPKSRLVTYTKGNIEIWKIPESGVSTEPPMRIPASLVEAGTSVSFSILCTRRCLSPLRWGIAS